MAMDLSSPFKEDRQALSLSATLSSRRSMVCCLWLCARRLCLKLLNTSDLPRSKPLVMVACFARQSVCSVVFPFTPVCPGQLVHGPTGTSEGGFQSGIPILLFTFCSKPIDSLNTHKALMHLLCPLQVISDSTNQVVPSSGNNKN